MNRRFPISNLKNPLAVLTMLACCQQGLAAGTPRDNSNGRQSYTSSNMSCLIANDFYAVHFTAIQEGQQKGENTPFVKYCQEIPAIGKTFLSIDLLDRDVRTTPISLRVIEESVSDDGRTHEIKSTLSEVPARIYRNGTADTHLMIDKPGHYALIATIGDGAISEDDRLRIPFTVGLPVSPSYSTLFGKFTGGLAIAFFAVMGVIGYRTFRVYRPKTRKSVADDDAVEAKVG
ncbi:hypothetical protein [Methylococcus sp. EFPC2]|uniref:hypothetical protein n=1 Tax=Methylococcus sp. EFPC2 TaxID=2812648 RepID=UPI0019677492|nr:hypothetical protein [Methylococcus sp. EFPC2]QSA97721.1 hypothetical protein JWZ97_02485 [Methylococcus sp. EFPC2]